MYVRLGVTLDQLYIVHVCTSTFVYSMQLTQLMFVPEIGDLQKRREVFSGNTVHTDQLIPATSAAASAI